ncbi:hypothetical protein V6N13_113299 [Hibiscus sabdariffa]
MTLCYCYATFMSSMDFLLYRYSHLQPVGNDNLVSLQSSTTLQGSRRLADYVVDVICKRAELGYNYGVILIPEVQQLIVELNEILSHDSVDEDGQWKKKLTDQSLKVFDFLPVMT